MKSRPAMLLLASAALVIAIGVQSWAFAAPQGKHIDYGSLFTGKKAPPGAKAKLKRAAQLAIKSADCASVGSGFYIPPNEQLAGHKGKPYMVTCKSTRTRGYYNVYFGDADLASSRTKGEARPVSENVAIKLCAKALERKFPTARLKALETAYNPSKYGSNVLEEIGLTVENQFGIRVHRIGKCIITPRGNIGPKDVWLVKG